MDTHCIIACCLFCKKEKTAVSITFFLKITPMAGVPLARVPLARAPARIPARVPPGPGPGPGPGPAPGP